MNILNENTKLLIREASLAYKYKLQSEKDKFKIKNKNSILAIAYEKARNSIEYREEHLIRQATIERILKRRLFLNQSNDKIVDSLIKELGWIGYVNASGIDNKKNEKLRNIIKKYRETGLLVSNNQRSDILLGICACEIDETLNFEPINQIVINYVFQTLKDLIEFNENDIKTKNIQIYIGVERGFAKNSETLIRYKLLKVLLPKWKDTIELVSTIETIEEYLKYKYKDLIRRKISQMAPPFNLIRDFVIENQSDLENYFDKKHKKRSIK